MFTCNLCPRKCNTQRKALTDSGKGFCNMGENPVIARAALHFWEEPCISGDEGSGTVFFSCCNMKCVYCQNYGISTLNRGMEVSADELAEIRMLNPKADLYLCLIEYAKKSGVPVGPGRGSGAASLAAYCIGITGIDPIKYNLFFERFLNPERVSMPDFDIDFCYIRRPEVIKYVIDKYGADALRLTLITGNAPGNDMRFYWERIESSRNFANKVWNASRFIMLNLEKAENVDNIDMSLYLIEWACKKEMPDVAVITGDNVQNYDEESCINGSFGLLDASEFMKEFMKIK